MSLSSAARKQAKQKLKTWLPQLDGLTEVASDLVQESLPFPDVPSVSSSCASDDGDASLWDEDEQMAEYMSWRAGDGDLEGFV